MNLDFSSLTTMNYNGFATSRPQAVRARRIRGIAALMLATAVIAALIAYASAVAHHVRHAARPTPPRGASREVARQAELSAVPAHPAPAPRPEAARPPASASIERPAGRPRGLNRRQARRASSEQTPGSDCQRPVRRSDRALCDRLARKRHWDAAFARSFPPAAEPADELLPPY